MLLKFLLFAVLIGYTIHRISGFMSRVGGHTNGGQSRTTRSSNVHVDSTPKKDNQKYDGGEYVDFEEVK